MIPDWILGVTLSLLGAASVGGVLYVLYHKVGPALDRKWPGDQS